MRRWKRLIALSLLAAVAGCAPKFQSNITPIRDPEAYHSSIREEGLTIGFQVMGREEQIAHFNVELTTGDVLPIRMVVRNDGHQDIYLQAEQIFGRSGTDLYPAYRLDQSIERIRQSQLGQEMARGAIVGLIVGAAVGAAGGAAIGGAADDRRGASTGAALGGAIGGTSGGIGGAAASVDATSQAITRELRKIDWGNRVVYPGRLEHGFLFLRPDVRYDSIEVLLQNLNQRTTKRVRVPLAM